MPLINSSVTNWSFVSTIISAMISSNAINNFCFRRLYLNYSYQLSISWQLLDPWDILEQPLDACLQDINTSAHIDPYHTKKFYQWYHHFPHDVLDSEIYLFFLIQSLQLLVFCMDGLEFVVSMTCVPAYFPCNSIKVNHYFNFFIVTHFANSLTALVITLSIDSCIMMWQYITIGNNFISISQCKFIHATNLCSTNYFIQFKDTALNGRPDQKIFFFFHVLLSTR